METLQTYFQKTKNYIGTYAAVLLMLLSPTSCGNTTPEDIMKEKQKIELMVHQIHTYKAARKETVKRYNKLLGAENESNRISIEKLKSDLYDEIMDYNKKIEGLTEDIIDSNKEINEWKAKCGESEFNKPQDPNKYDYLDPFLDSL